MPIMRPSICTSVTFYTLNFDLINLPLMESLISIKLLSLETPIFSTIYIYKVTWNNLFSLYMYISHANQLVACSSVNKIRLKQQH